MRGAHREHRFLVSVLASIAGHAGLVWVGSEVGFTHLPHEARDLSIDPDIALDFSPAADERAQVESDAFPAVSPPPVPQIVIQPPPPPVPQPEIVLGIDKSDQASGNWIGSANPTPHAAPKSLVEQPALDPNAGPVGQAGNPGGASPSAPSEITPGQVGPLGDSPESAVSNGTAERERLGEDRPNVRAGDQGKDERASPGVGAKVGESGLMGPPLPPETRSREEGPASGTGESQKLVARGERDPLPPSPSPVEARQRVAGVRESGGEETVKSAVSTGAGNPGSEHAGERSERESDASSLTEPVEVLPGQPAAAEGLEIITRRPIFTRYTRTTVLPDNPRIKVTFDRTGRVTKAVITQTSGYADVDNPVINSVYQWVAKGERLAALTASGEFTLSVQIILR